MRVKWLCSCSDSPKSLLELNVCGQCQCVSCHLCQRPELSVKYCPGCFKKYELGDQTRCSRNCLECGMCESQVILTSSKDKVGSRRLILKCHGCGWDYKLKTIDTTQSLTSYVNELRGYQDKYHARFRELQKFYSLKRKLQDLDMSSKMGKIDTLDETTSHELVAELSGRKIFELINEERPSPPTLEMNAPVASLPRGRRLKARYNFKCPSCDTWLTKCYPDPRSSRFLLESCALQTIPELRIIPLSQAHSIEPQDANKLALAFCSAFQSNSRTTDISLIGSATIYLPVPQFTIQSLDSLAPALSPTENLSQFITRIPTYLLSSELDLVENERVRRTKSRAECKLRNFQNSEVIDQGNGWTIVPIHILESKDYHNIQLIFTTPDHRVSLRAVICS
ncbi:LADA_0E14136g1_1 [Lachancea dasiensis]|uniref:Dynactin subunit 4 n=1 Tax=Lachancea dasiensis TaxID=1072105 RepID=A0A1G4JGP4_9SACH|nr:LADA_0E14136g1_1 [Lachancea dasiensis]